MHTHKPPPSKGKRQMRNLKEGSPGKVGGRSGKSGERKKKDKVHGYRGVLRAELKD